MEPYNTRSPEMWRAIRQWYYPWKKSTVIDLGVGGGDLIIAAMRAGAISGFGIDNDDRMLDLCQERVSKAGYSTKVRLANKNLETPFDWGDLSYGYYDVCFCTSVLPYVRNWDALLWWMQSRCECVIVEAQYIGDGPGSEWGAGIKDDADMSMFLSSYWDLVTPIGKTEVVGRGVFRTIWMCRD